MTKQSVLVACEVASDRGIDLIRYNRDWLIIPYQPCVLSGQINLLALTICAQLANQQTLVPSSRGLGHRPLTAETPVRNRLGLPA
jgi:hypothetical protein